MGRDEYPKDYAAAQDRRRGLALVAPALLWTVAFFLVPLWVMATWSLFTRTGVTIDTVPTLTNYFRFFGEGPLVAALWNSLRIAALVTLVSIVLGYPIAYVIAFRVPERW